jgi:hypothetical protein
MDAKKLASKCWEGFYESAGLPDFPWDRVLLDFAQEHKDDERPLEELVELFKAVVNQWKQEVDSMYEHWRVEMQRHHDVYARAVKNGQIQPDEKEAQLARAREQAGLVKPLPPEEVAEQALNHDFDWGYSPKVA